MSIVEVAANPTDPMSRVGLAGDIIDLVPFVTGVGEATKAIGATITITNKIDNTCDTIKIVRAREFTEEALDTINSLDKAGDMTKSTAAAGRKIHKGYKTGYDSAEGIGKETVRGRNRMDFYDEANQIIYELKPCNPHGIRDGIRQLQRYNKCLGGDKTMILELY